MTSKLEDVKSRRVPQIFAAGAATVGAFGLGTVLGWSSPALPTIDSTQAFILSNADKAWLGSLVPLGALISCPVAGYLAERIGRKGTMMLVSVPFLIGWLMVALASNLVVMEIGRFITGFCGGSFSVTVPMYISEISDNNIRGTLISCFQLMVAFGVLFSYIVGSFVAWNWLAIICAIIPVLFIVLMIHMPESPRYLLSKGRVYEAGQRLCWLRGAGLPVNVEGELRGIKASIEESRRSESTFRDLFKAQTRKPTEICLVLHILQQTSGINAVVFYTVQIFIDAGSELDANVATIIVGIVLALSTAIAVVLVDRTGRRILLIISEAVMALSLVLLGSYFYLKDRGPVDSIGWLPLLGLSLFVLAFNMGIGPLPWLLIGELLPPDTKGKTAGLAAFTNWLLAFLVTQFFGTLKNVVGDAWCYWIFAIICVAGTIFVYVFVPETKGKSLDEIQEGFNGKATNNGPGPANQEPQQNI